MDGLNAWSGHTILTLVTCRNIGDFLPLLMCGGTRSLPLAYQFAYGNLGVILILKW